MSAERITQLHQQASQHYLSGDYRGALGAWRDVLVLDPGDQQAIDGIRMATQFVDSGAPTPEPALAAQNAEIEQEVDRGLRILDGIGMTEPLHFGDDGAVDSQSAPQVDSETESGLVPEVWESESDMESDGSAARHELVDELSSTEELSLTPTETPAETTVQSPAASAAAAELKRRVEDLLKDAKNKADAGERDDALAILSRLAILDEDNAAAEALRASLERSSASDHDKIEQAIIEGVSALEAGRLDDAERFFREVLARAPGHREAEHYLEKVSERRAVAVEDLLVDPGGEAAPQENAVQRATADIALATPAKPAPQSKKSRAAPIADPSSDTPPAVRRPQFRLPAPKVLIAAGVGAVVLIGAAFVVPAMFRRSASSPKPVAPVPHRLHAPKLNPTSSQKQAPGTPSTPEERANALASSLTSAQSKMAAGDFGAAVISFNEALTLEPGNQEAKAGLLQAGERYKASKADRDAQEAIRIAFRDGEFTSGLRLAYRLPPSVSKSYADAIKVVGWYNLAIVSLRAGDCKEALAHIDEALQVTPSDAEAKTLREFAARCADATKDRAYLNSVEVLSFRPTPAS